MNEISLADIIEVAVKTEELGARIYADLAKKFEANENIRELFNLLARDEIEHRKQFMDILKDTPNLKVVPTEIDREFLKGIDLRRFFDRMEESVNYALPDVLNLVYEFEKESVLYYQTIKEIMEVFPALDEIIKIEKAHMLKVMSYMVSDSKFRGIEDKW